MNSLGRRGRKSAAFLSVFATGIFAQSGIAGAQAIAKPDVASLAKMPVVDSSTLRSAAVHLAGKSGKLLARFVTPPRSLQIPRLSGNLTYTSKAVPAIHQIAGAGRVGSFSLITMRSFGDKIAGSVGSYRIGFWPHERERVRSDAYDNPAGFIEVTRENQDTRISEHFRLRDFLTHDQQQVWPKYLVLREDLVDKLELVIQELQDRGIPARNVQVLSGFRTPQYNLALGDGSGRARDSRHQYGDAADIFIDNNFDGRMDDLNRDGRVNSRDVRVVSAAVERVESRFPDLVGGVGVYHSTGAHGPFAHIDVRGSRVRWTSGARMARSSRRSRSRSASSRQNSKPKKVASSGTSGTRGK